MPLIAPPPSLVALQCKILNRSAEQQNATTVLGQTSTTGLPNTLKAGIEGLSGMPMGDVRVHYNSDKPAQVQAHAFTQGTDIHVAPGQEEHLPHEAWHAVQQKQKRVPTTMQMKGVAVNDDSGLEHEADEMGKRAAEGRQSDARASGSVHDDARTSKSVPTSSPVVQRRSIGGFLKGTGKVLGNVLLGPLWDAGKAIKRKVQGGNLFFGSNGYRRHARQYPDAASPVKASEYQDEAKMTAAYGGETAGRIGRAVNVLSTFAGDVAKYTGWGAGLSGLIMVASGGAAAPALAPITTILGSMAALGFTAKLALTGFNQAYLANRLDAPTAPNEHLLKEERYARSDYGRAMLGASAFAGIGIGAESIAGAGVQAAWLESTGQTPATSSLSEVAAGMSGETALESADTIAEENAWAGVKEFTPTQKPKKSFGLHLLNPVYLLVRTVKTIANGLVAIWNSFRPASTHKKTKEGAAFKVGDDLDGQQGLGLSGLKLGAKAVLGGVGAGLGAVGAVLGGAGGLVGGLVGGAWAGAKAGIAKGMNSAQSNWRYGAAFLGLLGGGLGGLIAGGAAGLTLGAVAGGRAGWDVGHGNNPEIMSKIDGMISGISAAAQMGTDMWKELKDAFKESAGVAP